ncbi:hypothetical protein TESG_08641 [Trichophyton tonsurans CBS 112818]|uniref:Uncharacterized protein n=1 Tax=Trichophyton tonsurans (strain CBS 112818) TaxID=647933 RepID=F2S9S3_TRIT1|nr:hypothetical protein TESG_08641 [Trichophyton tonsurans CBS 112818]
MKLSCSLLAALAILGQTAVAAVASVPITARAEAAAEAEADLPRAIIPVSVWASEDESGAPALAEQISATVTRKLAFSYGILKWYPANGGMEIRMFSG